MNLEPSIEKMLESYRDQPISEVDKVREILQQCALLGLARCNFFEHAAFYGGTALRILYGLDRFSEDLDFSLLYSNRQFDFAPFLESLSTEMQSFGFSVEISIKSKTNDSAIQSAFIKTNTLNLLLQITKKHSLNTIHPQQKIRIKLEIDTDPPPEFHTETKLILNPIPFYVKSFTRSDLFAGKVHALLCREWQKRIKGRDWFDFIWFVRQNIALNIRHLQRRLEQTGHMQIGESLGKQNLIEKMISRIEMIDWKLAKNDVAPFISDQKLLDLWDAHFFKEILTHLKIM